MSAKRILLVFPILAATPVLADTETLELGNGDKLTGEVVERDDERVVIEHPLFGRIEIPTAELKQPEPPNPGLFGSGFLEGWTRTFSAGLSGENGESDKIDLIAALDGDFEDDANRIAFDARYNLSSSEGDTTTHNAMTSLGSDWLFPQSRWFTFAKARFDYDDFRSWTLRLQGETGVGYDFIETESFDLRARTGPSVANEWKADEFRAEWVAGPELVWRINHDMKLEASNFIYYSFTPWGEFRNLSRINWKLDLTEDPDLSLNAGAENEYQSDVDAGAEHNNLKYYTTIGIDF